MTGFTKVVKSVKELGLVPVVRNGCYQALLKSGIYRAVMPHRPLRQENLHGDFTPLPLPDKDRLRSFLSSDSLRIFDEKEEIIKGVYHPFGQKETGPLDLNPVNGSRHWATDHKVPVPDLKLIWEGARFCWVDALMRSEALTRSGLAESCFWERLEEFNQKNPVNLGENWESAQEVGIRLINVAFAAGLFLQLPKGSDIYLTAAKHSDLTRERSELTAKFIQAHARRITKTMIYARAQRNNHLLSEGAALMTAAMVLPKARNSKKWWNMGRSAFFGGLNDQIAANGCYIQHSANYHRMMLQLAVWVDQLLRIRGEQWPAKLVPKLRSAVRFLYAFCDPVSGKCCNTGHNDGSLLFCFGSDYGDYSPTLQAAGQIFLGKKLFTPGARDELCVWLNVQKRYLYQNERDEEAVYKGPLRVGEDSTRAMMLAEPFIGRPAHDDRLHVDIWVNGINEVIDAGTYRYSGVDNWENRLKSAVMHNVLTIDRQEPMTDAGKFLWLDRDQTRIIMRDRECVIAEHNGFRRIGLNHRRTLRAIENGFSVVDDVIPTGEKGEGEHFYRFHWLLPNQSFTYKKGVLVLDRIRMGFSSDTPFSLRIVRSGFCVFNSGTDAGAQRFREDTWCGWYSPTYNVKEPALSVIVTCKGDAPFHFDTLITKA